jgi:hypothetical protein
MWIEKKRGLGWEEKETKRPRPRKKRKGKRKRLKRDFTHSKKRGETSET